MAYAKDNKIPIPVSVEKPYSTDRNLLHISFEGGILEDPWAGPPEDMFILSVPPEKAPDRSTTIEIDFEDGVPKRVDGRHLSPAKLLSDLNALGGETELAALIWWRTVMWA